MATAVSLGLATLYQCSKQDEGPPPAAGGNKKMADRVARQHQRTARHGTRAKSNDSPRLNGRQ